MFCSPVWEAQPKRFWNLKMFDLSKWGVSCRTGQLEWQWLIYPPKDWWNVVSTQWGPTTQGTISCVRADWGPGTSSCQCSNRCSPNPLTLLWIMHNLGPKTLQWCQNNGILKSMHENCSGETEGHCFGGDTARGAHTHCLGWAPCWWPSILGLFHSGSASSESLSPPTLGLSVGPATLHFCSLPAARSLIRAF